MGEYKQTRGVVLPPGFGQELKTNDTATQIPWMADFTEVPRTQEPMYARRFFFMILLVALMVYMALLLV